MNSIKNFGLKFAMFFVALICANVAFAQGQINAELKIKDFQIKDYDTQKVEIYLDNQDPVAALEFRFTLPEELEFADGEDTEPVLNYDRLIKNNHVAALNVKTGMVLLQSLNFQNIKDGDGPIMSIPVKVKEGMLESGKTVDIKVSGIVFSNGDGTASGTQKNFDVHVMLEPFTFTAYLTPDPVAIYPGGTQKVDFCLKNVYTGSDEEAPVAGFTVDVKLPEGLSISSDPEDIVANDDRVFGRTIISYDNGTFMVSDFSQNKPLKSGYSDGPLFSFVLTAADDYKADDTDVIELSNFEVSAVVGAFAVEGETVNCGLVSTALMEANKAAYDKVIETIDALQTKYEEALAEAKEANPDYDFAEYEELIPGYLKEARENAARELAAANEDMVAFNFAFDGSDVEAMIEDMKIAPARDAQAAENQVAYDKVIETIDALQAQYEEALAAAKEANPEYDFSEYEEMISGYLKEARENAGKELAAANEDMVAFNFPFDGSDVEAMIEDMKIAPARDANAKANEVLYNKVVEEIDGVEAKYEEALEAAKKAYPEYDFTEAEEIITNAIKEAREGAAKALEAANDEIEEFEFLFNAEDIEAMIEQLLVNDPKLAADNQAAYDKVIADLDAVEAKYEEALAEAKKANPDYDFSEWEELIPATINAAREAAAQALAAATNEGEEFFFPFDTEEIENMIADMKNAPATSALQAANQAAYDKVIAELDAVELQYEEAVNEIKEKNPEFDLTEFAEIIEGAIKDARDNAAIALWSANEDGEEFNFVFSTEEIENMIAEMKAAAGTSGVSAIEAEVAAGKAFIFTLDGKMHQRVVVGEVNVIVRENSTTKVFINK